MLSTVPARCWSTYQPTTLFCRQQSSVIPSGALQQSAKTPPHSPRQAMSMNSAKIVWQCLPYNTLLCKTATKAAAGPPSCSMTLTGVGNQFTPCFSSSSYRVPACTTTCSSVHVQTSWYRRTRGAPSSPTSGSTPPIQSSFFISLGVFNVCGWILSLETS